MADRVKVLKTLPYVMLEMVFLYENRNILIMNYLMIYRKRKINL